MNKQYINGGSLKTMKALLEFDGLATSTLHFNDGKDNFDR